MVQRWMVMGMDNWNEICETQDLPRKDGEYIVLIHSVYDFLGEPDEREIVKSAFFHFEQKVWEVTPYEYLNALLPIFDLFDTMTTDYISHWMSMPDRP